MNIKTIFTSSFFLRSIFATSLFILLFITGITFKHMIALADSAELLVHSYKVHIELDQLNAVIRDAESGQRGYIITKDSSFLLPYTNGPDKINESFSKLTSLIVANTQQQLHLDSLRNLVVMRFQYLAKTLEKDASKESDKYAVLNGMREGRDIMNLIRIQINKMVKIEITSVNALNKKYKNEISFTPLFTLLILLFSLLVFIFSYIKISKDYEILKRSNDKLLISTESITHAEEIGNFSSWQWDMESNKFIYSDNQYRLLGCEPQSFEAGIEGFLEYVHPMDKHIITEGREQVMNENKYPAAFFRIIRKDGELRYFKSLSKLLTDAQGKKILIGINSDVTEEHLINISLEERNRELEQSNKELASFNHVASHDLQEPLRKIQTFISRISENEISTISKKGMEYFIRIQSAAERMRILIDDLLLFSRTNKAEKIFEKTDLNNLLENAKQELVQVIEDKKAIIQSDVLPILAVISFQIQQLFINLIGNSLKYNKPGIAPFIKIECERINDKERSMFKTDMNRQYYKITFTDNGLGFEQGYAESIFILFNRLHQTNVYPGTGIGLAICKKIVENHAGHIRAEGNPGVGAVFTVFLPA